MGARLRRPPQQQQQRSARPLPQPVMMAKTCVRSPSALTRSEAIPSLLAQAHENSGIIAVDGASTDGGEWITFLDADDMWSEDRCERTVRRLRIARA